MHRSIPQPYYIISAFAIIGIALIYALTPLLGDDLWYLQTSQGKTGFDAMAGVWSEVVRHWYFDTGRLANIVNPPFLTIIPKWVFALLSGAALWINIEVCRRLASIPTDSFRAVMLVVGIVFALPWIDYMFTVVFALNYLWASAMSLLAVYFILRSQRQTHIYSRRQVILISCLCFLAGWMHEGFSVPALCGLGAYALVLGERPRRLTLLFATMFALGAACIFMAPAFWSRSSAAYSILVSFVGWEAMASVVVFNCLYYLFVVFLIVSLLVPGVRRRLLGSRQALAFLAFLLVMGGVALAIFLLYYNGSRMGWLTQLTGGLGFLYLCGLYRFRLASAWRSVYSAAAILLVTVHLSAAVVTQYHLMKECDEIIALYDKSNDGVVYYDNIKSRIDFSLGKPSFRPFNERYPLQEFSCYYGPYKPNIVLLPTALENMDLSRATPTSNPSIVLYGDNIISTEAVDDNSKLKIEMKLSGGSWVSSRCRAVNFIDSSGRHCALIVPHLKSVNADLKIIDVR